MTISWEPFRLKRDRGYPEQLTDRVGVDDVIVRNIIADHDDVLRSHELLTERVDLGQEG